MDGLRTIALRLDFGVSHNQTFEKYQPFYFAFYFSFLLNPTFSSNSRLK